MSDKNLETLLQEAEKQIDLGDHFGYRNTMQQVSTMLKEAAEEAAAAAQEMGWI